MGVLNIKSQQLRSSVSPKTSIAPAIINLTPGTITYDGTEKTQGVDNIIFMLTEGTDYMLAGTTAINAGTHTITAIGTNNYKDTASIEWTIQKANSSITPSVSSLKIQEPEDIGTFTIITTGDGTISVSSSNSAVATATLNNNTITVTPIGEGTATIIVTISESNNYNEAKANVEVNVDFTKVFGVVWNYNSSSPVLTRLTPASDPFEFVNTIVLADPIPAIGTGRGSSQFDNYMPWKGMEEYNVINNEIVYKKGDSNFSRENDTVIYIPEFYYRIILDSVNSKLYFYISNHPFQDFEKHPGSGAYIGKYHLGSGYVCRTGMDPQVNMTRATARTNITSNLGSKWSQWGLHHWNAIQLLYIIEFAHWNSQSKIGLGLVKNSTREKSGKTDTMTYHTGIASDSNLYEAVQYRGIENLWGNVNQWIDGVNMNSSTIYCCTDPSKYYDSTTSNYINCGSVTTSSGYISSLNISSNANWVILPNGASGTSSTYIPDYYGYYNSTWWVIFVGGGHDSDKQAGLFYTSGVYTSYTGSYITSRPVFIP